MVNEITLIGRVGKDSETKSTTSGKNKEVFSIATSHSYKKGDEWIEQTTWHNVELWRDRHFKKGQLLRVKGRQENRQYKDKDGVNRYFPVVSAREVMNLSGKQDTPLLKVDQDGFSTTSDPLDTPYIPF